MTLALDTTTLRVIRVRIDPSTRLGASDKIRRITIRSYADKALAAIGKKIGKKKPGLIGVVAGPGAFSATRNGVALANALAFAWRIPIVSLSKDQFDSKDPIPKGGRKSVAVIYAMGPNITVKKKK